MGPRTFLNTIRRNWIVVVAATILGLFLGWALSAAATPVYTASSRLYFSLSYGNTASDLNQGSTYTQSQMLSFAQLANSPLVLNPVAESLKNGMTADTVASKLDVSIPLNTVVLQIDASDTSAKTAAALANGVAGQLGKLVVDIAPKTATGTASVTAKTIQPAAVPTTPSSPDTKKNILYGGIAGLLIGVLFAVLRGLLDTRLRTPSDLSHVTELPLLGEIRRDKFASASAPLMLRSPGGAAAESYRQLVANLRYVDLDNKSRTIVVTSPRQGEGKSSIALNLAIALAEADARVLLVDADLRRPAVAARTGLEGAVGLTTVLVGRASLSDAVQAWGVPGLHILAAGGTAPNPSELLASKTMARLVDELRDEYDVVVFDSAPVLALADSSILAGLADSVLLIVDRTRTRSQHLLKTQETLARSGARVSGIVLNRLNTPQMKSSYYTVEAKPPARPSLRIPGRRDTTVTQRHGKGHPADEAPEPQAVAGAPEPEAGDEARNADEVSAERSKTSEHTEVAG